MENKCIKYDCLKSGLTKDHSKMLQGLAILMMLYHHMFSTPEALGIEYISLLNFAGVNIELHMAWFFKICVGIYAFVSGYGLCVTLSKYNNENENKSFLGVLKDDYKLIFNKLLSFYTVYWLVFIIFVPIGFIFFNKTFVLKEFILNFLGISSSYNGAWWYVLQYLKMLLILPIMDVVFYLYKNKKDRIMQIIYSVLLVIIVLLIYFFNKSFFNAVLDFFQPAFWFCFLAGYFISKFSLYELVFRLLPGKICYFLGVLGFLSVIFVRVKIAKDASSAGLDFVFVPVFVFGFICIMSLLTKFNKFFSFFGIHSTIMWLCHVFYYDHYAKKLVMMSHFSTLIYLSLIILSLITSIVISKLYSVLKRRIIMLK